MYIISFIQTIIFIIEKINYVYLFYFYFYFQIFVDSYIYLTRNINRGIKDEMNSKQIFFFI